MGFLLTVFLTALSASLVMPNSDPQAGFSHPNLAFMIDSYILAWEFIMQSCLMLQNPCSNHEIHMLFELGFCLKKPKLGPDLHA